METTTRPFWTEREILKHECDQFKSTLKLPALDAAAGEGVPLVEKKTEAKASGSRFESLLARRSLSTTVALALVSPRVLCRRSPSTTVARALATVACALAIAGHTTAVGCDLADGLCGFVIEGWLQAPFAGSGMIAGPADALELAAGSCSSL